MKKNMSKAVHSGTGRIGWIRMRPMSLWESEESTGEVSMAELFAAPEQIDFRDKNGLECDAVSSFRFQVGLIA